MTTNTVTPANIHRQYCVGSIQFDNVNGLGATPWNQEVRYMGFAVTMPVWQFFNLIHVPVNDMRWAQERGAKMAALMREGTAIATPFLQVSFNRDFDLDNDDDGLSFKVVGHEGMGRMSAISIIESDAFAVPVHILPTDGIRARHFNASILKRMRTCPKTPQYLNAQIAQDFKGPIYWNGEEV